MDTITKKLDFNRINALALDNFENLVRSWLPDGKKNGHEFTALNPTRTDSHAGSFTINLHKGIWKDFASGDGGSDPISLFAYLFHSDDQGAAAKELAHQLGVATASAATKLPPVAKKDKSPWQPITPPFPAPEPHKAHIKRGFPEQVWCYRSGSGSPLGYVYRFRTSDGGKVVLPLSWCRHAVTGEEGWRWMAFAEPRWLYGLDQLAHKPDAPVLVVEGEKCADAAAVELPHLACVTWAGGSKAVDKSDWAPLAGRDVVIWPDCDAQKDKNGAFLPADKQPGWVAANRIAVILQGLGCQVWLVDIAEPGVKASGWDVADAIAEGLTGEELRLYLRANSRLVALAGNSGNSPPSADAMPVDGWHEDWQAGLICKARGGYEDCRENVYLILSRHPAWDGVIGWNDFTRQIEKRKPTPYGSPAGEWKTADDYETGLWLAQQCDLLLRSEATIIAGVAMCADKHKFHPPRDWLESLPPWDGIDRLEHFIADGIGCANSRYVQLVGKYLMIGIVARVFKPGCPMQYMPILEGAQGIGKSSLWRALGGEWFQDTPLKLGDKDAYMQLRGTLIYEIAEMDSFNKAESTAVKGFVTQENDRFREPYAHRPVNNPRQCVFVGTTNHGEYLKDSTGNRRFWPLQAVSIDLEFIQYVRPMLFAEALYRFRNGEKWHPGRDEERMLFVPEQDDRRVVDPWLYPLQEWLEDVSNRMVNEFTGTDLLTNALRVELNKIDNNRGMATRIGNLMAELGWSRRRRSTGLRERVYVRPGSTGN